MFITYCCALFRFECLSYIVNITMHIFTNIYTVVFPSKLCVELLLIYCLFCFVVELFNVALHLTYKVF